MGGRGLRDKEKQAEKEGSRMQNRALGGFVF
jgi:hypothetical protein